MKAAITNKDHILVCSDFCFDYFSWDYAYDEQLWRILRPLHSRHTVAIPESDFDIWAQDYTDIVCTRMVMKKEEWG